MHFLHSIHTFGNMGFGGAFHAAMAPLATKLIDLKAYDGVDVRKKVSQATHENGSELFTLLSQKVFLRYERQL